MLLICGEIDLAVGRVFALSPALVWWLCDPEKHSLPLWVGISVALLVSACVGLTSGVITTFLRVPSFITTLGMLFFLNGITLHLIEGSQQFMPGGETFHKIFGSQPERVHALPQLRVLLGARARSRRAGRSSPGRRWGLWTFATGGNLIGAAESGVNVRRIKIGNFVLANFLAGFAGILDSTRITTIVPLQGGPDLMFLAVAGAVIGGTSLFGGVGTVDRQLHRRRRPDHPPHRPEHHRRQRLHVRPDHRPRDPAVDDRERPGRPAAQPREAAVTRSGNDARRRDPRRARLEELRCGDRARRRLDAPGQGRGAGTGRRQRRRQVDADQDPHRLHAAGLGAGSSSTARKWCIRSVDHARSLGIDTVYQDLALVPSLSVAHNMFLKRELTQRHRPVPLAGQPRDAAAARASTSRTSGSARCGRSTPRSRCSRAVSVRRSRSRAPSTPARPRCCSTSRSRRWARAKGRLILDLIRELKERGDVSMIVIAHNYVQVFEVADRVNLHQERDDHVRPPDVRDVGRRADGDRRRRVPGAR